MSDEELAKAYLSHAFDKAVEKVGAATVAKSLVSDPQKPHAWAIQACSRMWTGEFAEIDAKAEAARCGGPCYAYPLYTAPPTLTPPPGE